MELLAETATFVKGVLVIVSSFVLFVGTVWLLLAAIFGVRMGYLMTATGFFAFMIVLASIWSFGAPGTPKFLGPKGELPHWVAVSAGLELSSSTYPAIERYPAGPWKTPGKDLAAEVEPVTLTFEDFLAEEANAELREAGIEGEVTAEDFAISDLRFATIDGAELAAARGFAVDGGPVVEIFGFRDKGDESLPSYLFLAAAVLGFAAHLPFLDRAERRRKEILTGGDQSPWRGPA